MEVVMNSLIRIALLVVAGFLSSCNSLQPQPQSRPQINPKILDGEIFPLDRTYGGHQITYRQALQEGKLVFARNRSGNLILAEPKTGLDMIPGRIRIPESRGMTVEEATESGHFVLRLVGDEVQVLYAHRP
ncbi:MAG: hypothetical protein JWP09_608 [Candidatus Taylorbacteria bacterium]|nr:hypothetical protein [Candidatus Taylorbacteria bacterium]